MAESLKSQIKAYPDLAGRYESLQRLFEQKLFHQLTVEVADFVMDRSCWKDNNLIFLYNNFVASFEDKLNQLKLVQIATICAQQFVKSKPPKSAEIDQAVKFLRDVETKKEEEKEKERKDYIETGYSRKSKAKGDFGDEPFVVLQMAIAELLLQHPDKSHVEEAYGLMAHVQDKVLPRLNQSKSVPYSAYYRVCCEYYKLMGPADQFYDAAMNFLGHTQYTTLKKEKQQELASDLCIASLIGETVFNFGEVLTQPILQALKPEDAWLAELLQIFEKGDVDAFAKLCEVHEDSFRKLSALEQNAEMLRQKIGLLSLMRLVFERVSVSKTISLEDIAKEVRLESDMVEWMLMRAMAKGLIKGKIDGVNRVVHIDWLKPRVLREENIASLDEKLLTWKDNVKNGLEFMSAETPELLQA